MDYSSKINRQLFIENQLSLYSGKQRKGSNYLLICCPFHPDKTPSFKITKSGYGNCYACDAKSKKWDDFAELIGLKPYKQPKPKDEFIKFQKENLIAPSRKKIKEQPDLKILGDLAPNKKWRTISTNLLIKIGAKVACDSYSNGYQSKPYIFLPVKIKNKTKGYIRAAIKKPKNKKPSYLNSPGNEWREKFGLFPFDYSIKVAKKKKYRTLVLTEGPRDSLKLLQYGIPAVSILGTQYSDFNQRALFIELAGINNIILCMDGDDAGIKANKKLKKDLQGMFNIYTYKLPDDIDPCIMGKEHLLKLKKLIERLK